MTETEIVQTLVFLRHGEKPDNESGQLTCKGLNRALALPDVLLGKFGTPDALYAAAPRQSRLGNSMRSVQTISPTAIRVSLPVHLEYHARETKELCAALLDKQHHTDVIFIVWEHENLVRAVRDILKQTGGDPEAAGKWPRDDFDSLWVLTITRSAAQTTATFRCDAQKLYGVSPRCP